MPNRWTRDEQKELLSDIKTGITLQNIAKKHNRSILAIEIRLQKIIYDALEAGTSVNKLSEMININKKEIIKMYKIYVNFINKNKNNKDNKDNKNEKVNKTIYRLSVENRILKKIIRDMTNKI
jgi:hypothetical protein